VSAYKQSRSFVQSRVQEIRRAQQKMRRLDGESDPELGKLRPKGQRKIKGSDLKTQNRAAHSMKVSKTALLVFGVFTLALGIGGMILALHWPFSQEGITQSLQEDFPVTVSFQKFHSAYFPHPGCVGEGLAFRRLSEFAFQVSLHALRFDQLVLDHRPNSIRRIYCWHLPPANLNQEFLSSFSCARLFDLLRHRFEYAKSLAFGLSIQTSHRFAK
jgi:hypothetical protein